MVLSSLSQRTQPFLSLFAKPSHLHIKARPKVLTRSPTLVIPKQLPQILELVTRSVLNYVYITVYCISSVMLYVSSVSCKLIIFAFIGQFLEYNCQLLRYYVLG